MAEIQVAVKRMLRIKRRSRLHRMDRFQKILVFLLTLLALFMLLPIVNVINRSLMPFTELFIYPPRIFVRQPTWQNFVDTFNVASTSVVPITRFLFNSIVTTAGVVFGVIAISLLCAYPLSKHLFPGRKLFFSTILLTLMFIPEIVQIPRYLVASELGIMNTYFGHILPALAMPVGVFLLKQFIDQVPRELIEASKIDGGSEWFTLTRIITPMVMPAIATTGILIFQQTWVSPETSVYFMQQDAMKTFPFYLNTLSQGLGNTVAGQGVAAAATLIMFLPNFIIFLIFQRKVIATMAHSGIK